MTGELREKCAVSAVVASGDFLASQVVYDSLEAMQHRGEEGAGIVSTLPNGDILSHHGKGLVTAVFRDVDLGAKLAGPIGLGHDRYGTNGKNLHLQPFYNELLGYAFAHNGQFSVIDKVESFLQGHNIRTNELNDSEMGAMAVAQFIGMGYELPDAVRATIDRGLFGGAYSCVASLGEMAVAFRDPKGIRPLSIGKSRDFTAVMSETHGLDVAGAQYLRDVEPGELVVITKEGIDSIQLAEGEPRLDMFEFVYFASRHSYLYGQSVNEVRRRFGERLAEEHPPITDDLENTLVISVPHTSDPVAEAYAHKLGLEYRSSISKSRYAGRTFIKPKQHPALKKRTERSKYSVVNEDVRGRDTIVFDDSIVRLNTAPGIVAQLQAAGAKSVSLIIGSAMVMFPNFYGINTPNQSELAASHMTLRHLQKIIGADHLGYLSLEGMVNATGLPASKFDLSCFTGEYPIDIGEHKRHIKTPVNPIK